MRSARRIKDKTFIEAIYSIASEKASAKKHELKDTFAQFYKEEGSLLDALIKKIKAKSIKNHPLANLSALKYCTLGFIKISCKNKS